MIVKQSSGGLRIMRDITLEKLLEAGCHFGHQVNRRNPRADEFIFEERDGVHIINLENTRDGLLEAAKFLKELSEKGGSLIVVGTKKQAQAIVKEAVEKALKQLQEKENYKKRLFYVTSRWIGGTLTNFDEVKKNYKKLKDLSEFLQSGKTGDYTKRELLLMEREKNKLDNFYGGISDLENLPDALYIIDTHLETTSIREAKAMGVATIGIVDTNADPASVDYPIPANDDAVGSIKIITEFLIDEWIEGAKKAEKKGEQKLPAEEKKESKKEEKV